MTLLRVLQKVNVSPAYLRNDGNKYLNYTDDWYILKQKPDEYLVIYYRGNNDAWKGYGGATIYTRCSFVCRCMLFNPQKRSWCMFPGCMNTPAKEARTACDDLQQRQQ